MTTETIITGIIASLALYGLGVLMRHVLHIFKRTMARIQAREVDEPHELVNVKCADCPKTMLVSKATVVAGADFYCIECWKARSGIELGVESQPQDVCENCECAMPEGCGGEFHAEESCRLKQQGGA